MFVSISKNQDVLCILKDNSIPFLLIIHEGQIGREEMRSIQPAGENINMENFQAVRETKWLFFPRLWEPEIKRTTLTCKDQKEGAALSVPAWKYQRW